MTQAVGEKDAMIVAVVGASPDPDRFAFKAQQRLRSRGHHVIPVTPLHQEVAGIDTVASLSAIDEPVDTVTLYLSPKRQAAVSQALLALRPRRVIFNPGTENPELEKALDRAGIKVQRACTLVLLNSGHFDDRG